MVGELVKKKGKPYCRSFPSHTYVIEHSGQSPIQNKCCLKSHLLCTAGTGRAPANLEPRRWANMERVIRRQRPRPSLNKLFFPYATQKPVIHLEANEDERDILNTEPNTVDIEKEIPNRNSTKRLGRTMGKPVRYTDQECWLINHATAGCEPELKPIQKGYMSHNSKLIAQQPMAIFRHTVTLRHKWFMQQPMSNYRHVAMPSQDLERCITGRYIRSPFGISTPDKPSSFTSSAIIKKMLKMGLELFEEEQENSCWSAVENGVAKTDLLETAVKSAGL